jgi:hypothetical protein
MDDRKNSSGRPHATPGGGGNNANNWGATRNRKNARKFSAPPHLGWGSRR